ncbi:hypothetical protein [Allomuricauda sp. d1]|uniref:hypothetical protein n=1 Tax=Allomuricauda sp. d1 TaxID=3136725 RepID=UPI0031D3FD0A
MENYLNDDEWYGENKKPHAIRQREAIVNNIDTETFPNFLRKGIIVAHTNLRRIPTNRPGFDTYSNEQLASFLKTCPIEGIHQEEDRTLKGRYIIGEAVITSVMAGGGNDRITVPLIDEIYAMTNILEH